MYQLIPYIERMVKLEEWLGDSRLAGLTGPGRRLNRVINLTAFMGRPGRQAQEGNDRVLRNVARLLQLAGVEFGYLYEDDLYSGALAHDLGADAAVTQQACRVQRVFKRHGVRNVITVDPHTTNMLRSVYPRLIADYGVNVRSYLEVLAEKELPIRAPISAEVVLHDSCVYARYEQVVQEPRELLRKAGVTIKELESAGRFTLCCGGPLESLYPRKAVAVAQKRVEQLRQVAPEAVTMCPLCQVNLRKASGGTLRVMDISEYLQRAHGDLSFPSV
jgi:Fe-S oxidoreductase